MSGISTKYPLGGGTLPFMWFNYSEEDKMPNQIYPNWRRQQRLPLDLMSAHPEHVRHNSLSIGPTCLTDWRMIQFLLSIRPDETQLAILMYQGYGGDEIIAEMVFLRTVVIACDAYRANVRVDYYASALESGILVPVVDGDKINYHWSALVLAIAPLQKTTPFFAPQIITDSEEYNDPREWTFFLDIVSKHGIPKN